MIYRILSGKNNIKMCLSVLEITTENISDIFSSDGRKKIIYDNIKNNNYMSMFSIPDDLFNKLFNCVINDVSNNDIINLLIEDNLPLFSIMLSIINNNKKYYKALNDINNAKKIYFDCDTNNFINVLKLCENINTPIIIEGTKISLEEYYMILSNYDTSRLSNKNIKIYYQSYNTPIDIEVLYNISMQINYIVKKIKKYNLSALEQIMLVFDIVKNNVYFEEKEDEDFNLSRTLDNVLNSNYIVCAGYVAIINAIVKALGYNTEVLLCNNKKHCRTAIYVEDDKYNIDGVYVFDPTFDNKSNDNNSYINNYEYFALPYNIANITSRSDYFDILDMSLIDIKNIYNNSISTGEINKSIEIYNSFKKLFLLPKDNRYEYFMEGLSCYDMLSFKEQEKLNNIYLELLSKYKTQDIDINSFIRALYKVRRIEYYLSCDKDNNYSSKINMPMVDKISITGIKRATIKRYYSIARTMNKDNKEYLSDLGMQFYKVGLEDYLDNNLVREIECSINEVVDRDILNMRLLKSLKKRVN